MAWDPYRSIAPCWLSRSGEQTPSAVGPGLLHPALLRARVKVALTTVSAADIQWPDLHQHMPAYPGAPPENEQEAYCIQMANLNDNPAIAAYYF